MHGNVNPQSILSTLLSMTICTTKWITNWEIIGLHWSLRSTDELIQFGKWKMRWISDTSEMDLFRLNQYRPQHVARFVRCGFEHFGHCNSSTHTKYDIINAYAEWKRKWENWLSNTEARTQIHNNICTKHVGQCVVTFLGDWMRLLAKIQKAIFSGHSFSAYRKLRVHGTHAIGQQKKR